MKRLFLVLTALSMLVLCSCTTKTATTFDSKSIDNGYNNFIVGGKMAYVDNSLYVSYLVDDYKTLGTYKFNNYGVRQVLSDVNVIGSYAPETPRFYQFENKLYVIKEDVFVYDEANDKLTECEYDEITAYFTDDLKVGWKNDELTVSYKDYPDFIIEDAYQCYVEDDKIYFTNTDGWLYCIDVTKGETEPKFLSYLSKSYVNFLHVIGDRVYFDCDSDYNDIFQTGLYCYSLTDESLELVLEGEINCLNSYENILYIATDKGIFKYENNEVKEITSRGAKKIYLFDEDWIYTVENDAGNVYRVSLDGDNLEIVDFIPPNQGTVL